MAVLTIELPPQQSQTAFNLRRWAELCADSELAKYAGKIETDRFGHIVMMPPAAPFHGGFQAELAGLLLRLMPRGKTVVECAISTADGVKAADVAWASAQRIKELGNYSCFPKAPEICVEVISPRNTRREIAEKTALYFDAGAREVWTCSASGAMKFFRHGETEPMENSRLCPAFPRQIKRMS
jgi:Uma2 family endonuclease